MIENQRRAAEDEASTPEEAELAAVLDQYLSQMEEGQAPDLEELVRAHPRIAARLRDCLTSLRTIQLGADGLKPDRTPEKPASQLQLSDYRIIREIGRGGMAVVYEAQQLSLNRRVALKILPFAATLDRRQMQRFQNEAMITAQLDHPNIVSVYAVGSERGTHFYAMQYIDGYSLEAVTEDYRRRRQTAETESMATRPGMADKTSVPAPQQPGDQRLDTSSFEAHLDTKPMLRSATDRAGVSPAYFRTVARIGVQAAEALHYAHQWGVIHRDIKPSNLLIDANGDVCIADFGLARIQTGAELTMTGDVLGTLRYMSPEQALGKREQVDHRTDIYSLGATIYELLTLQPLIDGDNRQQILQRISSDVRQSPRKSNKAIPIDLETIVLKSLAPERDERYASAKELAEDLQRFVEDKPILAKRPTLVDRANKWAKRHKPAVAAALFGFLIVLAGLVAFMWRETRWAELALHQALGKQLAETQARREVEKGLYYQKIARADLEWWNNDVGRAERLLDSCPEEFRDWEWRYLKRLCQLELFALQGPAVVRHIAFSPNGRDVVAGSFGAARVWDLASGNTVLTVNHPDGVADVAFSPDGTRLATSGGNWRKPTPGTVNLWDVSTGDLVMSLGGVHGHRSMIGNMSFNPDGRQLATAGWDGVVKLWDLSTGKLITDLRGHDGSVKSVAFSPDGTRLATGGYDETAKVWDATTHSVLLSLPHTNDVGCLTFSPDGQHLVCGTWDGNVTVWDLNDGRKRYTLNPDAGTVWNVAFSADGKSFAAATRDAAVRVWNVNTGARLLTLRGHSGRVSGLSFSPSGNCLVTAGRDATIKVWDITRELHQRRHRGYGYRCRVVFSPSGKRLAVARSQDDKRRSVGLEIMDVDSGQVTRVMCQRGGGVRTVAFNTSGEYIATDWGKNVKLWRVTDGRELDSFVGHTGEVTSVAFCPSGNYLASGAEDHTVRIWSLDTSRDVVLLEGHTDIVSSVAYDREGKLLSSASRDRTVIVWDAQKGRRLFTLKGHDGPVHSVAFSPTEPLLASAGDDRTIRLWNTATGHEVRRLTGETGVVSQISFSADGRRLVSAGHHGNVRIWDPETGHEVLGLRQQLQGPLSAEFSPDGRWLAAADGESSSIIFWDSQLSKRNGDTHSRLRWHAVEARGYEAIGKWELALWHLNPLVEARQNDPALYYRRAVAHSKLRQWEQAIEDYRALLELQPEDHAALNNLARIYSIVPDESRDPDEGLRLAERAIEFAPTNADYLNTLGAAYYRVGRYHDAVRTLDAAIRANWNKPRAFSLVFLAMSEHQLANHPKARRSFHQAVQWLQWYEEREPLPAPQAEVLAELLREAKELLGASLASNNEGGNTGTSERQRIIRIEDARLLARARASQGMMRVQPMRDDYGPSWSEDRQFFWMPTHAGARLALSIEVDTEGMYAIHGAFTRADDYGQFQLHVNGQKVGEPFDGFNHVVIHSGRVTLGSVRLRAGKNDFVFDIVGKSPDSKGYYLGIDNLELVMAADKDDVKR